MTEIVFELNGEEYIELKNVLKLAGLVQTGGQVKFMLDEEMIMYNDTVAFQKKKKCFENDVIIVDNEYKIIIKK